MHKPERRSVVGGTSRHDPRLVTTGPALCYDGRMIERHHYFKLKPEHSSPEGRAAVVQRVLEVLPTVPGVVAVTAGPPADPESERSWDVFVTVRFRALADVEAYRAHPAHRDLVDGFLTPRIEVKKVWNFTSETAPGRAPGSD